MKNFLDIMKMMKDNNNITLELEMKKNFLDNLYWMYNNDFMKDNLSISKVNIENLAMENHKIINQALLQSFAFDWININAYPIGNKTVFIEAIKVGKDSDYIIYMNNSRIEYDLLSIYQLDKNLSRNITDNIKAEIEFKFNKNIPSKDALFSIILIDEKSANAFIIVKEKIQYGESIKFNATVAGLYTIIKETTPIDPLVQLTLDLVTKSSDADFWNKPEIFKSLIKKVQDALFPLDPAKILDDVWVNLKGFFKNYLAFVNNSTEIDVDVLKTANIYLFMDDSSKKYANFKNYTNDITAILDNINKNRNNSEQSEKDIIDEFNNNSIPEQEKDNSVKIFSAYLAKIINIDMILNKKSTVEFKWKTAYGIAVKFDSNKASLKLINENINIQLPDNNSNITYAFAFSADSDKPGFIKKQNDPLSNYIVIGLFDCCFNRITKANILISLEASNIKDTNPYDSAYFGHSIDYNFTTFSNVVTQFDATKKVASFNNANNIGYFYLIRNTTMTDIISNLKNILNAEKTTAGYWADLNSYSKNLTYIRENILNKQALTFHEDVFMYINVYFKSYDSYIQSNNFTSDVLINSKTVAQLICFSIDKFKFGNWSDSCLSYINSTNLTRDDLENYLNTILTSLAISDEVTREKFKVKFENLIQSIYKIDFPSNASVNNTDIILDSFNIKAYLISNTTNSSTIQTQDAEIDLDLSSNNLKYLEYIEMDQDSNFIINKPTQIISKIFTFNARDEKFMFSNASLKTFILKKIKFFINPENLIAYNCFALQRNVFNEKGYQWLMTKFNAPFTAGNKSQGFIECPITNNTNAFYTIIKDTRSADLISSINTYISEMAASSTWWITKSNDAIIYLTSKLLIPVILYIPEVFKSVNDFVLKYSDFLDSSKFSVEAFGNTTSTVQFVCAASNISDLSNLSAKCSYFINQYNKAKDDEMQKIIDSLNNKSNGSAPVNRTELKEKLINTLKTVYSNNFKANSSLLSLTQDLKTIYVTVSKIVSASINKISSKNITLTLSLTLKSRLSRLLEVSNNYLEAVEFDPKNPAYLSVPTNPRSKLVSVSVLDSTFSKIITSDKIMNGTLEFNVIDYSIFKNYDCSFLNQSADSGNWTIIEKNAEEHYDIKTNTAKVTCKVNEPGYYAVTLHEDTLAEAAKNIGIIVGPIVAGIVLILIFIIYCWRRRKTRYENEQEIEEN